MVLFNHCIALISVWRPQHDVYYGRSTICMTADVHIVRWSSYACKIAYRIAW